MTELNNGQGIAGDAPSPKRPVQKKWIVLGVVVAVIVVAGAGFWAWHNTPGFCNAFCHSPMDAYVETLRLERSGHARDPAQRGGRLLP